jgi:hypothetical protein
MAISQHGENSRSPAGVCKLSIEQPVLLADGRGIALLRDAVTASRYAVLQNKRHRNNLLK